MADVQPCPVPNAHRRLRDVHEYWHALSDNYMNPDAFRRTLNTAIQELRNISFLVQKEKASVDGFDSWYPDWQQDARADKIMRWLVESRNRVVKQGDLDLFSKMTARYHVNWVAAGEIEVNLPLHTPLPLAAEAVISQLGVPPFGLVTVKRRWVDYALSGTELLEALAHVYAKCAGLLDRAHEASDVSECLISLATDDCPDESGSPTCMMNASQRTEVSIDVATRAIYGVRRFSGSDGDDEELTAEAIRRYGDNADLAGRFSPGDALALTDLYIEMGKRILATDENLVMLAVFFREDKIVAQQSAKPPADHYGKVLWADDITNSAVRHDATSVLISADAWAAPLSNSKLDLLPVADRPDRYEVLSVMSVSRDGRAISKQLPYHREPDGTAVFGDVLIDTIGHTNYLEPLRKAWGVEAWQDAR